MRGNIEDASDLLRISMAFSIVSEMFEAEGTLSEPDRHIVVIEKTHLISANRDFDCTLSIKPHANSIDLRDAINANRTVNTEGVNYDNTLLSNLNDEMSKH